jgi:cytochrome c oxidase cbb3-type subunit 4
MDPAIFRAMGTLTLFLAFVGLCVWAWAPARKTRFDEAARLPFLDEDDEAAGVGLRKPR